jgi:hypothetical protein
MPGWIGRFDGSHPGTTWQVRSSDVLAVSPDGTRVRVRVPFAPLAEQSLEGFAGHLAHPWVGGVILVRRGGFAIARLEGAVSSEVKIGRRHVQGRTKAGGWSQQRFARRRDNQAREAFDAAADHAHRLLGPVAGRLDVLGFGGDRQAVASVLAHPGLSALSRARHEWLGGLPDPSRTVLDRAIALLYSVRVEITDPTENTVDDRL